MLVRMKARVTGVRDGVPWPGPGETLEVSDGEAESLVAAQAAELVGPVEVAALAGPETPEGAPAKKRRV
jgi:hypothetical protein